MFDTGQLKPLADRKRSLLAQSAAHRRVLTTEAARLKPVIHWVDLGLEWSRKIKSGYSILGPLLDALWHPTAAGGVSRWVQRVRGLISVAQSISALWKQRG